MSLEMLEKKMNKKPKIRMFPLLKILVSRKRPLVDLAVRGLRVKAQAQKEAQFKRQMPKTPSYIT